MVGARIFSLPPSLRGKGARGIGLLLLLTAPLHAEEIAPAERLGNIDRALLSHTYAEGAFKPEYDPPAPGTYALPVMKTLSDHPVVDSAGDQTSLFALKKDRLAVVAFIYTACSEVTGCPLSQSVLQHIDRALAADSELAAEVVLISASFDPQRDTPQRLRQVRSFYEPKTDWQFVTTSDEQALQPLLDDFGQTINKLRFEDGQWSGLFRHVLKVFLVDRRNHVRNIYSVGFLNPPLVLNDLRTLVIEQRNLSSASLSGLSP
jgi:cytochrome c peroxidase